MFQSATQTIMSLDSRVCQIDVKLGMLLVSTLTRCYICDTIEEQYRQIGQKMRDGEFGACFVNKEKNPEIPVVNMKDYSEARIYNIANDNVNFTLSKELKNTSIFCARPSSRLWEASIDGTVKRTHQFKQVLGNKAMTVVSVSSYENEKFSLEEIVHDEEGRSVNFAKIYSVNGVIFAYKKDAIYFLNIENVDHTVWLDKYKDILDCKVYHDMVYIWLINGSLINLKFMKLDKFLVTCYVDEKYDLCAEVCSLYGEYLLSNDLSAKLHILSGLSNKVHNKELLNNIKSILERFEKLKLNDATQMKSGIYVVDNTYNAQSSLLDDDLEIAKNDDYRFVAIPPDAIQTLKDLSITMSGKLNTSKKILKEKWEDFEGKMKYLNIEKQEVQIINTPKPAQRDILTIEVAPLKLDNDIIYKESSQKPIEIHNDNLERDKICKTLYQYFRLSLLEKDIDQTTLISILEGCSCDIKEIYDIMLHLERYCISIDASEESKFVPNNIFLNYLNSTDKINEYLNNIIEDEILYKYFVDSCIVVNTKTQKLLNMGCECGFPLPYARTNQKPVFSGLINKFIERQWSSQTKEQCYDVCKRMPYLWRKILYLRRNEDLLNILRLLMQMLDENLLHSFLPQFTMDTWNTTVKLYATLHANICLNCSRKFHSNISVRDMLSWDDLGRLMIKSVGGRKAIKVMEVHANLIDAGSLTLRFYHTCLVVTMFEKYDSTAVSELVDALYNAYHYANAREEVSCI